MSRLGLASFRHGVHPPEAKEATRALPIRRFPFAPLLIVPLRQHLGPPALAEVREGERVVRGQRVARPDGPRSVAMHAPASGVVRRIALAPSLRGRMEPALYLEPEPGSTQEGVTAGAPCPLERATPEEIIAAIQAAGVVGLGGAGFPTHAKLALPAGAFVDTLIINGVECEPYLTTDHRVMLEQRDEIVAGIRYLLRASGAARAILAVEVNKRDAADALRAALPADLPASVELLAVKYPQGAEKVLVSALLGREVPSGGLPLDVHTLCINVTTTAEIGHLLPSGAGIQERVVTVTGPAVRHPGNYRVPIGTPLRFVLETVGTGPDVNRVVVGGPMMGAAAPSLDVPVTKGTTGVVAFGAEGREGARRPAYPCIRCGYCVDACPMYLDPCQLGLLAARNEHERMADTFHLMDCFECGCCSFVCPSHIPLVQQFRLAKAALRKAGAA